MRFIQPAKTKSMIKIELDDGRQVWAYCNKDAVYNYAVKSLKEGDEITLRYTQKNGQYYVDYVTKKGAYNTPTSKQTETPVNNPDTLKEDTETNYQSKRFYGKSPEEREQIKRLSILGSVCEAVKALPGQVDLDNIWDVIKKGYDELKRKIEE